MAMQLGWSLGRAPSAVYAASSLIFTISSPRCNSSSAEASDGKELAVSGGNSKAKLTRSRRNGRRFWWNEDDDMARSDEFFPSDLGNALIQATENMKRVMQRFSPMGVMGKMREKDECYKLRLEVPGMAKDDLKITIEDGILRIKGERKEAEDSSDDEYWSSSCYGYCDMEVVLPDDSNMEEVRGEMKDGVLFVTIPKNEEAKKNVKVVEIA